MGIKGLRELHAGDEGVGDGDFGSVSLSVSEASSLKPVDLR